MTATPLTPVVNAGLYYINGLNISNDSTTPDEIVNISAGSARDYLNINDIQVTSALSVDITNSGANGLDNGSVAADTFYAVHVIADSRGYQSVAGLLSTSATDPTLPAGYDMFRRVGYVLTDSSSDILIFDQRGSGAERHMVYRASIATDITSGSSATFAAVDVSGSIPKASVMGLFKVTFTPTGADDLCELRCGDSSTDNGQAVLSGSAAGVVKIGNLSCPVGATLASGVDYKVTGSAVAINVQGYIDELGLGYVS